MLGNELNDPLPQSSNVVHTPGPYETAESPPPPVNTFKDAVTSFREMHAALSTKALAWLNEEPPFGLLSNAQLTAR